MTPPSPGLLALIALGGGVGAVLRFLVDSALTARAAAPGSRPFPRGIAVVNVTGSLLLGLVTGALAGMPGATDWLSVLGVGVLGGYTTLSTASVDSARLIAAGSPRAALGNALGVTLLCVLAAWGGLALGSLFGCGPG
ncbi:fluoride efflux transporter FluC [Leucobacter sp. M11]|uniref:fluoride efflux transporter FluC n=1 Tax=Leucobacter sp. M11 TaxID=2993565 RepID=UPI002D804CA2|nr:CrcB family protein [Leucobacter sp. M11]MEB4616505.1 CrcB family protein [Leucobacter sp. M11]